MKDKIIIFFLSLLSLSLSLALALCYQDETLIIQITIDPFQVALKKIYLYRGVVHTAWIGNERARFTLFGCRWRMCRLAGLIKTFTRGQKNWTPAQERGGGNGQARKILLLRVTGNIYQNSLGFFINSLIILLIATFRWRY